MINTKDINEDILPFSFLWLWYADEPGTLQYVYLVGHFSAVAQARIGDLRY